MKNNRDRNGRPVFFDGLSPLANAIKRVTAPSAPKSQSVSASADREAQIAAQRKRQAKQERRLQREVGDVRLREEKLSEP